MYITRHQKGGSDLISIEKVKGNLLSTLTHRNNTENSTEQLPRLQQQLLERAAIITQCEVQGFGHPRQFQVL